jgi:hypothetical protein
MNGIGSDSEIVEVTPWYITLTIAAAAVMGALAVASAVMLVLDKKGILRKKDR